MSEIKVPKKPVRKIVVAILLMVIAVGAVGFFWWYTQRVPPVEYKTYSKYGFSFQYPSGTLVSEYGLLESTATDDSGVVFGEIRSEGLTGVSTEVIFVSWLKSATAPDLKKSLEDAFDELVKTGAVASLEKGKLMETTKVGHRIIYQYYTPAEIKLAFFPPGQIVYGICGVWYCDTKQRLYQLNLVYIAEPLPKFQRYLDSFVCH